MYSRPLQATPNDDLEDWERTDLAPRYQQPQPQLLSRRPQPSAPLFNASAFSPSQQADDDADWDRGISRHAQLGSGHGSSSSSGWDQNRRIWQEANTEPPLIYNQQAFPSLSAGSSSSSIPALLSRPPSTTNTQPKITLLRRPAPDATSAGSGGSGHGSGRSTPPTRSLGEREEEYRKARERIFAGSASSSSSSSSSSNVGGSGEGNRTNTGNRSSPNGSGMTTPTSRSSSGGGQSRRAGEPAGGGGGGGGGMSNGVRGGRTSVGGVSNAVPAYAVGGGSNDQPFARQPLGPPIDGWAGFRPRGAGTFAGRGRGGR